MEVLLGEPIGLIRPALYGQFAEHIGGVIYDGIWVGPDSKIPNMGGYPAGARRARSQARPGRGCAGREGASPTGTTGETASARPKNGPGGLVAGASRRSQTGSAPTSSCSSAGSAASSLSRRQRRHGLAGGVPAVGRILPCSPRARPTLADERAANGDRDPFKVRYWGVGNESWGCGGKFIPEDYCREYRKFTDWLPEYGTKPYLIAAGPNGNDLDWTRRFFRKWVDLRPGHAQRLGAALLLRDDRARLEILDRPSGTRCSKRSSAWSDSSPTSGRPSPSSTQAHGQADRRRVGLLASGGDGDQQAAPLRTDGLPSATLSWPPRRWIRSTAMPRRWTWPTSPSSSTTSTPSSWPTATVRRNAPRSTSSRCTARTRGPSPCGSRWSRPTWPSRPAARRSALPRVAGSASKKEKSLTITLVHVHASEPVDVTIRLRGGEAGVVRRQVLTHRELNAHNTFDRPFEVKPEMVPGEVAGGVIRLTLAPASVNLLEVRLA